MGGLPRQLFDSINQWIGEAAFIMTQGWQVDATFNRGSNFTKNNCEERYPENYQTKKQSVVFRYEDHIGIDAKSGLTLSLETTSANE